MGGQVENGILCLRQSLTAYLAIGVRLGSSHVIAQLAAAYARNGQVDQGLTLLTDVLEKVQRSGERYYEAEIRRLIGESLLMKHASADEAEGHYWRAIEVARQQSAKSWELRAVMSLCRLWRRQGKSAEALQMLHEIYGWFTEGFDTPDLQDAKVMLNHLAQVV